MVQLSKYRSIFAQGKNCEASRDSRCKGMALQTRPLLGNRFVTCNNRTIAKRCSLHGAYYSYVMQQYKHCWERGFLRGPYRGYIRSRLCVVSSAVGSPLVQLGSCREVGDSQRGQQSLVTEAEDGTQLEAAIKQGSEDRNENTSLCDL
jgi:hypothetical protein